VTRDKEILRILIVDDHPVMRDGLAAAIESDGQMSVVGEAGDGAEAIVRYRELRPDVTVIDLHMPGVDGLEAITAIMKEYPSARILAIASCIGDVRIKRALAIGAGACLLKTDSQREILAAIRSLANKNA